MKTGVTLQCVFTPSGCASSSQTPQQDPGAGQIWFSTTPRVMGGVQWFPSVGQEGGLEGDEVDQVALGRGHAFWKEVDKGVEELRPLSIGLVQI